MASASPRRRVLAAVFAPVPKFIYHSALEPVPRPDESAEEYVTHVSLAKIQSVITYLRNAVVLGADTVVVHDSEILGKPKSKHQAAKMLRDLRNQTHRVVTGVAVVDSETNTSLSLSISTKVTMRRYSDEELETYVSTGEPMDKAGAYAIQDPAFHPVELIDGCYLNVVGLPVCEVVELLSHIGTQTQLSTTWQPPSECIECPLRSTNKVILK